MEVPGQEDDQMFIETLEAMEIMGFSEDERTGTGGKGRAVSEDERTDTGGKRRAVWLLVYHSLSLPHFVFL